MPINHTHGLVERTVKEHMTGYTTGGIVDSYAETKLRCRNVESSNVLWIGWPASGEPLMVVCFRDDTLYGYLGVSRQQAVAAAHHPSTGQYINQRIKPHFEVVKLKRW